MDSGAINQRSVDVYSGRRLIKDYVHGLQKVGLMVLLLGCAGFVLDLLTYYDVRSSASILRDGITLACLILVTVLYALPSLPRRRLFFLIGMILIVINFVVSHVFMYIDDPQVQIMEMLSRDTLYILCLTSLTAFIVHYVHIVWMTLSYAVVVIQYQVRLDDPLIDQNAFSYLIIAIAFNFVAYFIVTAIRRMEGDLTERVTWLSEKEEMIQESLLHAAQLKRSHEPKRSDWAEIPGGFSLYLQAEQRGRESHALFIQDDQWVFAFTQSTNTGISCIMHSSLLFDKLELYTRSIGTDLIQVRKAMRSYETDRLALDHSGDQQVELKLIHFDKTKRKLHHVSDLSIWVVTKGDHLADTGAMEYKNVHGLPELKMYMFVRDFSDPSAPKSADQISTLNLTEGDEVYLMGDGLCSELRSPQRQGPDLTTLQNLLLDLYGSPADQKRELLDKSWSQWLAGTDSKEDLTVIGFTVS